MQVKKNMRERQSFKGKFSLTLCIQENVLIYEEFLKM